MTAKSEADRRRFFRVTPENQRPIRVDINGSNFIDILNALDISEGGVGVRVPHGFNGCDLNQPISFILTLPKPKHVLLKGYGRIIHISGDRFGIAFAELPSEVVSEIRDYIAMHMKEESWLMWLKYKMRLVA